MSLRLNTSSGGSVTLQEENTASNLTITVPAVTGTMLTTASTGTVLQVVNSVYTGGETSIASTSYTDSGLTASITPSSSTSKILVIVAQSMGSYRTTNNFIHGDARLVRGSTAIQTMVRASGIKAGTSSDGDILEYITLSMVYLDSPATTSSVTYKTQGKCNTTSNSGIVVFQTGNTDSQSTMTLMEIAA
jgi:hypothetical protein